MMPVILMRLRAESREVGQLKLFYEGGKPQSGEPSFWEELTPLDTMIFHFTLLKVI